jgi:hypothetical protein
LVAQPKDVIEHIKNSEILDWVDQKSGRTFNEESLLVMCVGPSGETLR